jgi:hypothetical protein
MTSMPAASQRSIKSSRVMGMVVDYGWQRSFRFLS